MRKLDTETARVNWRIDSRDLELLTVLFPGTVNTQVRRILNAYCNRLRERGFGESTVVPKDVP